MKALLVDGLNLVRRVYAAVPAKDERDPLAGAVASATASLRRALAQHRPSHCVAVFDCGGRNWRHQLFPDYKKNREPMPPPLRDSLARFKAAFGDLPVSSFSQAGWEADDIIATVAVKIAEHGGRALILSNDRNYCQLLGAGIAVFDHFAQRYLDEDMVRQRFQVAPRQLPELLSLVGDRSLSIPGVKSIGIRTAAKLLADYGTLEGVLKAAEDIPGKLGSKLRGGRDDARLARTLFTLKTNLDLGINLNQLRWQPPR